MAKRPATEPLDTFRPLPEEKNPNKHTQQGMGQLDGAMSRHGFTTPMTAAADGAVLDGNARLETAALRFPGVDPIVIRHDGSRPIVAIRTDIATADEPMARDIIVAANRVAEANLDYNLVALHELKVTGLDLTPFEFGADMLLSLEAMDGPAFTPAVEPSVGASAPVTDAAVAATGERLTTQFNVTAPAIKDVTCPHCGKDFGIDA